MQPIKQEEEVTPAAPSRRKRKRKSKAVWEDLPTQAKTPSYEWQKIANKKKKKVVSTPVRRSSRPRTSVKWESL